MGRETQILQSQKETVAREEEKAERPFFFEPGKLFPEEFLYFFFASFFLGELSDGCGAHSSTGQ